MLAGIALNLHPKKLGILGLATIVGNSVAIAVRIVAMEMMRLQTGDSNSKQKSCMLLKTETVSRKFRFQ